MSDITDFLIKISPEQTNKIINIITYEKKIIQMKVFGSDQIYFLKLVPSLKKNNYMLQFKGEAFQEPVSLTFKVDMGERLFFFKTDAVAHSKNIFLNKMVPFYELVRRKEPRYKVPSNWQQFALVYSSIQKNFKSVAHISDISCSGMKMTLVPELPRFELKQIIKVQFKIHKRAQITLIGMIKHLRKNKSGGPTLGLEFQEMTPLIDIKIQNICDDISYHQAHHSTDI